MLKKILLILLLLVSQVDASDHDSYGSFHQLETEYNYCSTTYCSNTSSTGTCSNSTDFKCKTTIKGYKDRYNLNDPKIYCSGQSSCTLPSVFIFSQSMQSSAAWSLANSSSRVYVPPGMTGIIVSFYGHGLASQCGTIAKFGSPPTKEEVDNFVKIPYDDIKDEDPNKNRVYSGYTILEYSEKARFVKNAGGVISTTSMEAFTPLTKGGWLYIIPYGGGGSDTYKYGGYINTATYKAWYSTAKWDANGDPAEVIDYALSVNPTQQSIPSSSGTAKFSVSNSGSGDMPWTAAVTSGNSWLSITSGSSGSNTGEITCSYQANTGSASRTATVRVTAAGATGSPKDITITQVGTVLLSVKPDMITVNREAGSALFIVSNIGTGTMPWTSSVTAGGSWLKITSGASGNSGNVIKCSYDTNSSSTKRTGTIRVTSAGAVGSPKDVKLTQSTSTTTTNNYILTADATSKTIAKETGTTTFNISNSGSGTMAWTAAVTSGSTWFKITSGGSGSNAGSIKCSYTANTSSNIRTATIRITASNAVDSPKDINISQTGIPFTSGIASFHQLERTYHYCSTTSCGTEGVIECNNASEHKCVTNLTGFKNQYNINDPKIYCSGQTSCSLGNRLQLGGTQNLQYITNPLANSFRVYVPSGSIGCYVVIYGMTVDGQIATMSRFGSPPEDSEAPTNYDSITSASGFSIHEYSGKTKFVKNAGGTIFVTKDTEFAELSEGGWLYIKILSWGASSWSYKYSITVNPTTYKTWYNNMILNNLFLSNGDPSE